MEKINELIKEKQEYIKEKEIIEQELNKKEQELTNNKIKINDLKLQNKLLNERLDNLKNNENNELKKVKIDKDISTMPKMPQDVRKRDTKAKTFAPTESEIYPTIGKKGYLPKSGEESDRSINLLKEYTDTLEEKNISNPEKKF